jgi:predicted restriction endonuclease
MTRYNSDFEPLSVTSLDLETSITMAGASQATFSLSFKAQLRATYNYRCVICLHYAHTSQCAHIIDAASVGQQQVGNEIVI